MDNEILTTPALIARAAARHGAHPAIESEHGRLTYAELDAARIDAARALLASGIDPGDRIAVWAPNLPHGSSRRSRSIPSARSSCRSIRG